MSTITVIVPALNEEGNLKGAVEEVMPLLDTFFKDYEILIFNDGSTDQTGTIADQLASKNNKIHVVHNPKTTGLGYNYKKGVQMSSKDYVIMIPGDNDITKDSFKEMFQCLGEKDMIIPYTKNIAIRPLSRQILSKSYTSIINFLFGLKVSYFNGTVIHKRPIIQSVKIDTDGFSYQTEALIKLLKRGHNYKEVGMFINERIYGKSKAFRIKNVVRVLFSILQLFYKIQIRKNFKD